MNNKVINKTLNYIIIFLVIILLIVTIINIFEPLKYNLDTKIINSKFDQSPYIISALDKYIYVVRRENIKNINKVIPISRRKNKDTYKEYAKYLDENFTNINIISINSIGKDLVLVKYTINSELQNSVIMKIFNDTDYFKVYYDEKLESIK